MTDSKTSIPPVDPWLARFAKVLVVLTFALLLIGGLVTTFGAGMAVATWPTIDGQMNPPGWWENWHVRLEHGHRLTAILVGVLTSILCAWIWRNWWALLAAVICSGLADAVGHPLHLDGNLIAQLRIWPAAAVFLGVLIVRSRKRGDKLTTEHWLGLAAYIAVCIQATLGGLRVTQETAGEFGTAMILRVVHGCFAQVFLTLVVILAARLSPIWHRLGNEPSLVDGPKLRRLATVAIGLYFAQLILAAAMRHPGAGLIIPLWPQAQMNGSWLPAQWNTLISLNFLHTRVIAFLLAGHVLGMLPRLLRVKDQVRVRRPGLVLVALVGLQVMLGVMVIWKGWHPHITTTHVFNGPVLLATAVLLAVRAGRVSPRES